LRDLNTQTCGNCRYFSLLLRYYKLTSISSGRVIVIEQLQGDAHSGNFDACLLLALHMA
jgi:hypothetical protein